MTKKKRVPLYLGEGEDRTEIGYAEYADLEEGPTVFAAHVEPEHMDVVFGSIMNINPLMQPRRFFTVGPLPDDLETS